MILKHPKMWVKAALYTTAVAMFIAAVVYDELHPVTCVEAHLVVEILEVRKRHAYVLLSNNTTHKVDQGYLKPGKPYCVRRKKQPVH